MALLEFPNLSVNKITRTVGKKPQAVFFLIFTLLIMGIIASRLAFLQLVEGSNYRKRAEANRVRTILKQPERGNIFDRNGKLLATTRYPHSAYVWPMAHTRPTWSKVGPLLSQILKIPQKEIEEVLQEKGYNVETLVRIARNLNLEQITALKEYENELQDVEIHAEAVRYYPHGKYIAHVIGYTRELTAEQLAKKKKDGYRLGDVIGQQGIEKTYEKILRGEWGGQQVEVDHRGRPIRVLGEKQAKSGRNIKLTLNLDIQRSADKALNGYNGAVVVMNPNNGAILALVSHPTFEPNIFSEQRPSPKALQNILSGKSHPLVNRALSSFPPASTFKIVTTVAALESGKFSPKTILQTYPSLTIDGTNFREWNRMGFGAIGFSKAIAMSSDTFFYQIAQIIGGQTLIDWAQKFGFGKPTGIDLSGESKGLVPDKYWKRRKWKMSWTVGDSINISIGQGALLTTPLQVAVMFSVPANGGNIVQPHLIDINNKVTNHYQEIKMKRTTLKILQDSLRMVITEGTGKGLNRPTVPPIAGKSGTAEAWKGKVKQNHAWFGAYAPADKPEIVVVAFAEHAGGSGSNVAGPMILQIMEEYFRQKLPGKDKSLLEISDNS
ncbi:Cell division protein FtsI [Peptidoglycan synthetase] [Richelia intracellularis HH01]|uniref:Cell division protein FtsI [Peptidoglycan synthetase] n=1 Tax=Richelia intracellularis HH01 TaxID=1165094 RepID=M1X3D1_9NOST|nr:penicillin-binding protein 2 [Richelia intracellularis]CCH68365.1 Cell division protein FtsI [Peptidoglycan synthetase] [Richelia intracellularis HH01]